MRDIYYYFDYREFLRDLYDDRKKANRHFSYRLIARDAGFSSAGFFTKIINGTSNISRKTMLGLAKVFKLTRQETLFLELLVEYEQASNSREKQFFFEKIISARRTAVRDLETDQYELFSQWYYGAIRELLDYYRFYDDFEELAEMLLPAITASQAKKGIEILENLQLITKNPDGYYERTDSLLSTGKNWNSYIINVYQKKMLSRAADAYDSIPREERDFSTLTLSITESSLPLIKEKLAAVRRDILEIAGSQDRTNRVYQVNMQIFPLTKKLGKR